MYGMYGIYGMVCIGNLKHDLGRFGWWYRSPPTHTTNTQTPKHSNTQTNPQTTNTQTQKTRNTNKPSFFYFLQTSYKITVYIHTRRETLLNFARELLLTSAAGIITGISGGNYYLHLRRDIITYICGGNYYLH